MSLFKKRLKEIQEAYDRGYEHGRMAGKVEREHEIIGLLTDNIESIDWVEEKTMEVRDVLPLIRNSVKPKVIDTWAEFEREANDSNKV